MITFVNAALSWAKKALAGYPELAAVLAAAIIGLSVQRPLAWLAARQGIDVLLAILVFATAVTIDPAALRSAAAAWRHLLAAVVVGVTVLPALSWAAARIVGPGPLRDGVLTVGLAPCEIASVATTALAGGAAAVAAGVLIGSTIATVALAGPILTLEAGGVSGRGSLSPAGIIASLALVVALPLAVGLAARAAASSTRVRSTSRVPPTANLPSAARAAPSAPAPPTARILPSLRVLATPRAESIAAKTALTAVAALVALVASEVHLSASYAAVAAALVLFLLASALVGRALGVRTTRPARSALQLTTSMRDFAIAAGLATAAFGPAAAAPLGLYGIAVLVWGTALAGALRRRTPPA